MRRFEEPLILRVKVLAEAQMDDTVEQLKA